MNDLLSRTLHDHAGSTPAPAPDLDALLAAGRRRVWRSRAAAGAGATVAAGLAGVMGAGLLASVDPAPPSGPAAQPAPAFAERKVGFATGSVIHWGEKTFDVGTRVVSYVQTDAGFVLVAPGGTVTLFDGAGTTPLGQTSTGRLVADDTGSVVAWTDAGEHVAVDAGTGEELARVPLGTATAGVTGVDLEDGEGAVVYAVDDGAAYWRRGDAVVRHDLADGTETTLHRFTDPADPAAKAEPVVVDVADVAGGQVAWETADGDGSRMWVGRALGDGRAMPSGWNGVLSPTGRYLAVEEADVPAVYDTATGEEVTPDFGPSAYAVAYGWESDGSTMAFRIGDLRRPPYAVELMRCAVPSGACTVVDQVNVDLSDRGAFVLPVGDPST